MAVNRRCVRAAEDGARRCEDVPSLSVSVPLSEPHAPIVALVLGQLLAVEVAQARGLDPARPRGLRKVTSTR